MLVGSGVDIYVFGEGINYDHKEFEGRAFDGGYKFLTRSHQPEDCPSKLHGTHVASLAAGKSVGVATKANVYRYGLHSYRLFAMHPISLITCNYLSIQHQSARLSTLWILL